MLKLLKQFYRDLNGSSPVKSEQGVLPEAEYLAAKRQEAINYLGDKWLGAKTNFVKNKEKHEQTI